MKTKDFSFEVPEHLVAQTPSPVRGASRLFVVNRATGTFEHGMVADLPLFLEPGTCMVFNDSRVRKARVFGTGETGGGKVEVLFTAPAGAKDGHDWLCMLRKTGTKRPGTRINLPGGFSLEIQEASDGAFLVHSERALDEAFFSSHGHIPLPPYIRREDGKFDEDRYQTVYAEKTGSAAAPTAGLHFTPEILGKLDEHGMDRHFLSLHVGLGTFAPVQTENIAEHPMHTEEYEISPSTAEAVSKAKEAGRKVLPVGTTSLRTLEAAWVRGSPGYIPAGGGSTNIFMYPGYVFNVADQLFTNFHTSESTLFMLVCAFAGMDLMKEAYHEAIAREYRFFSYGDAMLIR